MYYIIRTRNIPAEAQASVSVLQELPHRLFRRRGRLQWAVLYASVPFAAARLSDDSDPVRLILTGAALLMICFMTDAALQE